MKRHTFKTMALVAGVMAGCGLTANATIDLTFTWTGTLYESGFTGQYIGSSDAIGIYAFTSTGSVPAVPNPLYSVCLSPAGLLDANPHSYNQITFAAANPGIFPSAWASGVVNNQLQLWGIQNAAYLWNTYGMGIVNQGDHGAVRPAGLVGNASEEAAALEFAIWNALYNSKGYGQLGGNAYAAPTGQFNANELADFNAYNLALTAKGSGISIYTGYILEGTHAPGDGPNGGDDQEFFLLSSPVPEPTTLIAGGLLLLPFGASTWRALRRKNASQG